MRKRHPATAFLSLTALLPAQGFTAPPGYDFTEAPGSVTQSQPFGYTSVRSQFTIGGLRGIARPMLKKLELRRDGLVPNSNYPARTAYVALVLSETDMGLPNDRFVNNYKGPSAVVFVRKQVTLPNHSIQNGTPAPWSVSFPFDQPWSYSGNDDLLWEIQVDTPSLVAPYSLDAVDAKFTGGGAGSYAYLGSQNCLTENGSFDIFARNPITRSSGMCTITQYAARGPSNQTALLALGIQDALFFGFFCAPLRTTSEIALPYMTDALGNIGNQDQSIQITFPLVGSGGSVYAQFLAISPNTPILPVALSDAVRHDIVSYTTPQGVVVSRLDNTTSATATVGTRSSVLVPVARFSP